VREEATYPGLSWLVECLAHTEGLFGYIWGKGGGKIYKYDITYKGSLHVESLENWVEK
jgi:hypothetical protein